MGEARLAVILATDTFATIRAAVERWRQQTLRSEIELVLIAPTPEDLSEARAFEEEFAAVRIVADPVLDLALARAAGIRAASAPLVFLAETHVFPRGPRFAEKLVAGFSKGCAAVAPGFSNANPNGVLSWAGFLTDYGRWADHLPAGEIPEAPIYNAAYQRDALLELDERLVPALERGNELPLALRGAGRRSYLQPDAQLEHLNVSPAWEWVKERWCAGVLTAACRVRIWSPVRRLVSFGGSFLIPVVVAFRVFPIAWQIRRNRGLPVATLPAIFAGLIIQAAGEMVGYAGFPYEAARRKMHEYELHKLAYAGCGSASPEIVTEGNGPESIHALSRFTGSSEHGDRVHGATRRSGETQGREHE